MEQFTILLVDDREENLYSLEAMLANESRVFLKATSGAEALKLVLKHDDIGLILLDVQMPEMDGFEVAGILKSNPKTRHISIIFVTAIDKSEQNILRGFDEGAVDFLHKPLDVNVVLAKVNVFERLYFYQRDLKTALANLTSVNKQLEQFMYVVAHDLKSPLSGIIGMLSIIKDEREIEVNPLLKDYIELLSSAAFHLSDMITSILDYSKKSIDQQIIEEVDVDKMVREIAHLLFPPPHIKVIINDKLPVLKTRKLKLQQVFQNFISNAIKYNDKEHGIIEVGYKENGHDIEFYVKDNGPGIPKEEHEKIFKLFHSTNNSSNRDSSTGVGLNVIKMLVEEQGGTISVQSEKGQGSCFSFTWKR